MNSFFSSPIVVKIRLILGKITDVLIKGRAAGLWDKKQGPDIKPKQ